MGDKPFVNIKIKKLPVAIIPAILVLLQYIIFNLILFKIFDFVFRYEPNFKYLGLGLIVSGTLYVVSLHAKNRLLIIVSVSIDILLTLVLINTASRLLIEYPNLISGKINIYVYIVTFLPKTIVLFTGITQFDKGVKKPLLITIIICIVLNSVLYFSITRKIGQVIGFGSIINLLYVLIMYWFFEPYKNNISTELENKNIVNKLKVTTKSSLITVAVLIVITFTSMNYLINKYMAQFEFSQESMDSVKPENFVDDLVVKEMASKLRFNNEPFGLPRPANDLPEGLYVEKLFPMGLTPERMLITYDVECLLLYNNEFVTVVEKAPGEDGLIYQFYIQKGDVGAELFTMDGIGVGSTEAELLEVFPDYESCRENTDDKNSKSYLYQEKDKDKNTPNKEFISFVIEDGVIVSVFITFL